MSPPEGYRRGQWPPTAPPQWALQAMPGQGKTQPDTLAPGLILLPIMSPTICAQPWRRESATLEEDGAGLRPVYTSHHSPPPGDQWSAQAPLMLSLSLSISETAGFWEPLPGEAGLRDCSLPFHLLVLHPFQAPCPGPTPPTFQLSPASFRIQCCSVPSPTPGALGPS